MADDLKAQYVIELLEQGTGAKTAVEDLKSVAAAAKETTTATETMNAAQNAAGNTFNISAGQMKTAARALSQDLKLLALVSFPEVAGKGLAAEAVLKAVGTTSKLLGASVVGVAGSIAVLLPTIQSAAEAWKAYAEIMKAAAAGNEAFAASVGAKISAIKALAQLSAAGGVSDERRAELGAMLDSNSPARRNQAQMTIIALQSRHDAEEKSMAQWQGAQGIAENYVGGTLTGEAGQTFAATKAWEQARDAVLKYKAAGVDTERALSEIDAGYADVIERIHQEKLDNVDSEGMREVNARAQRVQEEQAAAQQILSLQDDLTSAGLKGEEKLRFDNLRTFKDRMRQIDDLSSAEKITGQQELDLSRAAEQAYARTNEHIQEIKKQVFAASEVGKLLNRSLEMVSQTSAHAFVGLITGAKDLKQSFVDLLKSMTEMVIQMLILKALRGAFGLGAAEGGVYPSASGGIFALAGGGIAGVGMVSASTFFPKYNVLAGEAGPEWLTVLSRPRMMEIGGIQAAVGNAGRNQLALTNAADLQRAGPGGRLVIEVNVSPDAEARITHNSINGAVVRVNANLKQDLRTPPAR